MMREEVCVVVQINELYDRSAASPRAKASNARVSARVSARRAAVPSNRNANPAAIAAWAWASPDQPALT